jgi:hypothetical protein
VELQTLYVLPPASALALSHPLTHKPGPLFDPVALDLDTNQGGQLALQPSRTKNHEGHRLLGPYVWQPKPWP